MARDYSRLASVEEKRQMRKALLFGILAIAFLILFLTFGLSPLAKFSAFLSGIRNPQKMLNVKDTTPPGPPSFDPLPDYTNKDSINLTGNSEGGATIKIFFNGIETETLADSDGKFSEKFNLVKGENTFYALAVDSSGNQSQKTSTQKVILDKDAPEITIDSPAEGASFFGSKQKVITIRGKTEIGSDLTINDRIASVDDSGNFTLDVSLSEGENTFNFKATDRAGNKTEKSLKVTFSP